MELKKGQVDDHSKLYKSSRKLIINLIGLLPKSNNNFTEPDYKGVVKSGKSLKKFNKMTIKDIHNSSIEELELLKKELEEDAKSYKEAINFIDLIT